VSPGMADIGAPSSAGTGPNGGGIECTGVTPAADAAALCPGRRNGRMYQHLRWVAQSNWQYQWLPCGAREFGALRQ
jgi:hypothetical protein